jgi:hypothetical protein
MDGALMEVGRGGDISTVPMEVRVSEVLTRAAALLPGHLGNELLRLTDPSALATMAAVLGIWAGSHFFGVGEMADLVLMVVGYAALGGVALQAGKLLYDVARRTANAHVEADYDVAARDLAAAISLLGVQAVLALLLRRKPKDTFRIPYREVPPLNVSMKWLLPRNGRFAYKPKLVFVSNQYPGWGATKTWSGDIRIAKAGSRDERLLAIYHERVHSFLVPKVYLLRNLRCHLAYSGYMRSYLLRYLEEALAETISRARVHGLSRDNLIAGIQFPLQNRAYKVTLAALGEEVRGIVCGPITVGGMIYHVVAGAMFDDE